MDPEMRAELAAIRSDVAELRAALDEFLPLIRAYLDPDQEGPRGWMMRRRLAQSNGRTHG